MSSEVFLQAISNMTTEVAYKGAIIHLYQQGLSVGEIEKGCLYPVKREIIQQVITEYEAQKQKPEGAYSYIEEIDQYGRKTFRRVEK